MKQTMLAIFLTIATLFSQAQVNEEAERLVQEGIALHDKGNYEAAISKYDAALKIDKKNFIANYEKIYSLYVMGKKKECADLSKDIIKDFADHPNVNMIYVQYGSALDDLGKTEEALKIYDEGISKSPNEYLLHFNKGLVLHKLNRFEEALSLYQNSLHLKPLHASSNYYTGLLLQKTNRVPALLAYATFLALEPQTKRSADALGKIQEILGANIKKEGNNTTIMLDPSMLDKAKKKDQENNFSSVDLIFSLLAASDNSKGMDSVAKSPADKMSFKLQMLINSLSNSKKGQKGFYWEHYVPFFEDMKEHNQVGTLAQLMYLQSGDEDNKKWIADNEKTIDEFYNWLKAYKWN